MIASSSLMSLQFLPFLLILYSSEGQTFFVPKNCPTTGDVKVLDKIGDNVLHASVRKEASAAWLSVLNKASVGVTLLSLFNSLSKKATNSNNSRSNNISPLLNAR